MSDAEEKPPLKEQTKDTMKRVEQLRKELNDMQKEGASTAKQKHHVLGAAIGTAGRKLWDNRGKIKEGATSAFRGVKEGVKEGMKKIGSAANAAAKNIGSKLKNQSLPIQQAYPIQPGSILERLYNIERQLGMSIPTSMEVTGGRKRTKRKGYLKKRRSRRRKGRTKRRRRTKHRR